MPPPVNCTGLLSLIRKSGVVDEEQLTPYLAAGTLPDDPVQAARHFVKSGVLTRFQANHLVAGRFVGMVIGPYRLLDLIGQGGAGMVFVGRKGRDGDKVAIKVLPPGRSFDQEAIRRFYREGRAVASLDHPNIVKGLDAQQFGALHYLVMEYVRGVSLQKLLDEKGHLRFRTATDYIRQVAKGLQHAHEHGLVHRDIKPGNLLLDRSGTVKILDMGLARFFNDTEDRLTKDYCKGALLGTADFLAPEQAVRCETVDIRADIYSLGATWYALLVGKPPFDDSKLVQKLMDHQIHMPTAPHALRPEIPESATAVLFKMMAKKPSERYQTPVEAARALRELLAGSMETMHDGGPALLTETLHDDPVNMDDTLMSTEAYPTPCNRSDGKNRDR